MTFTEPSGIKWMILEAAAKIRAALGRETIGASSMALSESNTQVVFGKDTRLQFKRGVQSPDTLAAEMVV